MTGAPEQTGKHRRGRNSWCDGLALAGPIQALRSGRAESAPISAFWAR